MNNTQDSTDNSRKVHLHKRDASGAPSAAHRKLQPTSVAILAVSALLYGIASTLPLYAQYALTFPLWVLACVGISGVAFVIITAFYKASLRMRGFVRTASDEGVPKSSVRRVFLLSFALIELAFLFALLSNYPGLCSPDSNATLSQVNGQDYYSDSNRYEGLTNAHPIFYTFLIWLVFKGTAFLGSQEASLFVFMFLQITFVAAALAWCVSWLARTGARKGYVAGALAFVVLSPVIAAHVIILWKDIPFAAVLLLLTVHLTEYRGRVKPTIKQFVVLGTLLLFVSIFRNNGYYVALFTVAFMIVFQTGLRKQLLAVAAVLVLLMSLFQGPIQSALSISKGHFAESVGIPLQQLAATVVAEGEIDSHDQEVLEEILPLQEWADSYNPSTSNPIKQNVLFNDDYLDNHKGEFLGVWARTLTKNFSTYVRAWVLETYGYWQPGYSTWIGRLTETANDTPAKDFFGIGYKPQFIANAFLTLLPAFFGMGSLIWFSLVALVLSVSFVRGWKRKVKALTPYIPALGLLGTLLIAAPIVSDYRYIFALYLVIPFLPQIVALGRETK